MLQDFVQIFKKQIRRIVIYNNYKILTKNNNILNAIPTIVHKNRNRKTTFFSPSLYKIALRIANTGKINRNQLLTNSYRVIGSPNALPIIPSINIKTTDKIPITITKNKITTFAILKFVLVFELV